MPLMSPESTASMPALPLFTCTVRVVAPRAIGFTMVSVMSAPAAPRISGWPVGTKLPLPQVTVAPAPPKLTLRSAV